MRYRMQAGLPFIWILTVAPAGAVPPLAEPSILLARPIASQPGRSDIGAGVLPIPGGALLSGWTSIGDQPPDGLLMRVTPDGEVVWRRQLGGPGTDLLWSILPHADGGYVVVGFTGSKGAGSVDGWIVHFDADGGVAWEKTYGGTGEDRLTAMRPLPDGFLAVGQTSSPGAKGIDAWVLRVDRSGVERSSWIVGEAGVERAFGILPTPDGGCVIAGMAGADLARIESFDLFVTRLTADGTPAWTHRDRRPGLQVAHDIHADADGTLLVVGYGHVNEAQGIDAVALRLTPDGKVASEQRFGGPTYDRANHAEALADGTSVVVGYSQRPGAVDEETGWDLVLYRLDRKGRPLAARRFGGEGYEYGRSVAGSADDLWAIGHTSTGRDGSSVLLIRIDWSQPT